MQARELSEMYAVEERHWWYAGKRILFERILGERLSRGGLSILDSGCGTGAVANDFARYGRVCATDRSRDALVLARRRGIGNLAVCDGEALPFRPDSFDLVFAFDVIEHVEDDVGMLRELASVVRPGGAIAIHVPAWPSLWSRHDEVLEHKRRYTRRGLRRVLERSGLRVEYLGWSSATILLPAVAMRLVRQITSSERDGQDVFSLPGPLNAAMTAVYRAEAAAAARIGLPFGLSLAAVAAR